MATRAGKTFLVIFTVFWCLVVGVFDAVICWQFYSQIDAKRRFVPVQATVVSSALDVRQGSKGSRTYTARVEYQYLVPGESLPRRGNRVSFLDWGSSDRTTAQNTVNANPPGATVTVYVDPAAPDRSVLSLKIPKVGWIVPLFLMPFNCIALGLIVTLFSSEETDPVRSEEQGSVVVIKPRAIDPMIPSLATAGALGLAGALIVALTNALGPPDIVAPTAFGVSIAAGILVYVLATKKRNDPSRFLRIDRATNRLTIPLCAMNERSAAGASHPDRSLLAGQELPLMSIIGVRLRSKQAGSVNKKAWFFHTLLLKISDEHTDLPASVAAFGFSGYRETGEAYRDRLMAELGLTEPSDPDEIELEQM